MREDQIRAAIYNLSGDRFERFARELLRRELYPGLNPTSASHDLGEDARTETSTVFMHGGMRVSVACSKTSKLGKIRGDCRKCRDNGRQIDVMVFATIDHHQETTFEEWKQTVRDEFGWDLEIKTIEWFAPVASALAHCDLVDDYLYIPPPGGDFPNQVATSFLAETQRYLRRINQRVSGISDTILRQEVDLIEEQLALDRFVVVTGDAGVGKSVIAAQLATRALTDGRCVLFLDARRVSYVQGEAELRRHLSLNGPVHGVLNRLGRLNGCQLIIDQLDNVVGLQAASVLTELVADCVHAGAIQIVVVMRKREQRESKLLQDIQGQGFVEIPTAPLDRSKVDHLLAQMGICQLSADLAELGGNLLNLDLIGRVKQQRPELPFADIADEVDLWEEYLRVIDDRETTGERKTSSDLPVAEAVSLASLSLKSNDQTICLRYPLSHPQRRLESWGIIQRLADIELHYQFNHEKLPEFLYAWSAAKTGIMPSEVVDDLGPFRSRNVLVWLDKIYQSRWPELHLKFLKATFNVQ